MVSDAVVMNFRIPAQTRTRLRILLLEEGKTLQEFFTNVVEQKFESAQMGLGPVAVDESGNNDEE